MADMTTETPIALASEEAWRFALWAEVLAPLIRLHDREPDQPLIDALLDADFPAVIGVLTEGREDASVTLSFARVLSGLPRPVPEAVLDELAADYTDAYLTHGFRAAPTGSVWMTEDHLERQEPMFAVRDFYAHYGLSVPDWRLRSEDHIVHELQFVTHLLGVGTLTALQDAAFFLDHHLLPWVPDYCVKIAANARHPFLAGVALVTRTLLLALRDDVARATGIKPDILPHAWTTEGARAARQAEADEDRPFVPGLAASW